VITGPESGLDLASLVAEAGRLHDREVRTRRDVVLSRVLLDIASATRDKWSDRMSKELP
jgi:hypothetical protein